MEQLIASRRLPALVLAGVAAFGSCVLLAHPGDADASPTTGVVPGRLQAVDLRSSSTDQVAPAPSDVVDAVAVATFPTVVDGVRGANLALRANGSVVGWGADQAGETRPPADLVDAVDVDVAGGFALAARSDGTVVAWGGNQSGALDVPDDLTGVTAVAALGTGACGYGIALRSDGTVSQWGGASCEDGMAYQLPEELADVKAVSAGDDAAIALKGDGTVVTWGPSGNLTFLDGVAPSRWTDVTQVSTQSRTFVGVTSAGSTVAYGIWGEAGAPVGLTDVRTASAGSVAAFLRPDGSALLWPSDSTEMPPPPYSAIEGGLGYVVAIVPDTASPTPSSEPTTEPSTGPTDTPTSGPTPTPTSGPTPTCKPGRHHHHPVPRPRGTRTTVAPSPKPLPSSAA